MDVFESEIMLAPAAEKRSPDIRIAWAYPSSYAVAMSGLGYQLIWRLLEQEPDTLVYRTFSDLGQAGWKDTELFGVTLSWELDYANLLNMLKEAAVPLLASQRDRGHPLVFGGGPVLTANPEPFAEIFDLILLGDAEITIPALIAGFRQARHAPDRMSVLRKLSKIPGIYVPALYRCVYEDAHGPLKSIEPLDAEIPERVAKQSFLAPADYIAHSQILSPKSSWGDMFLLELVRSCPQECRFCLASYLTRPFRQANIESVIAKINWALNYTKRVGIVGPSVTEHANFNELADALMKIPGLEISIASIRMDTIDKVLLKMLVSLGQRSVTIALESGSERLRSIMNKNLREDEIWQSMEIIAASGIEQVKFYGIAGLPGETYNDLDETVRLLTAVKKKHKGLRLVFGLSSFVPKAQTPYQWSARLPDCGDRMEYLRKRLAKHGIDVRCESHNWSDVQTFLSRADRRVTPLLLSLAENSSKLGAWKRIFRKHDFACPEAKFFVFREIPETEVLPWSHLVDDAKTIILKRQLNASREASLT